MPRSSSSQQNNQTFVRYLLVLLVGILFGRQWTLLTVDPHGVMPNAFDEEHANMQSLPKLQNPSLDASETTTTTTTTTRIRDLATEDDGTTASGSNLADVLIQSSKSAPVNEAKQDSIPTPPQEESNLDDNNEDAGSIPTPPQEEVQKPDETDEDDESKKDQDDSDGDDKKDESDGQNDANDADEGAKEEAGETAQTTEEPKAQSIPPISLETLAPKLQFNPVLNMPEEAHTHAPYPPNSDASAFGNETVDISEFQAEIDRRLPLWQAEAAKEDGLQDPPTVTVYDGVVLATKVHFVGRQSVNQMICMQKAAYNHRRNYPWVIFHTMPVTAKQAAEARAVAYPGTVTFVQDSPPLEEVVGNFTQEEQDYLINRCQCCHPNNPKDCCKHPEKKIDWGFWCYEKKTGWVTLSYAWQAVFRSLNIWTHPALKDYKYMVWIDDDAIPTKSWLKDPLKPMVEEDLVIFYDNFPAGFCKSGGIIEKMQLAYNHSYCYIHRIHVFKGPQTGKFVVRPCKKNKKGNYVLDKFGLVHGMMHITNLDIYRKPIHLNFQRLLTQHNTHPFSREWDDQIAVTVPAAFENPEKAWDMRMHGFNMSIHHNGKLDGKQKNKKWKYTTWWKYYKDEFPVAREMCDHLVKFGG